ncbi:MAG: sugar phosphate isomerase/epimerase [Chloroflexota bacterium]|nr:sugar phosphate isomerase/epimerase [Chloroflexota bacterium]
MRLSATVPGRTPREKVQAIRSLGMSATDIWFDPATSIAQAAEIQQTFAGAGVSLSQVSCYTNLECVPGAIRDRQMAHLRDVIAFAGRTGVRCVVSGCGHMNPDAPEEVFSAHPDNWTDAAMDRLVESCTEAAAWAAEAGTVFCAESWVLLTLDSPRKMREQADRVNSPAFGLLFDPVNLMNLDVYFDNGRMIREAFDLLGDRIVAVHAKDTKLIDSAFTYHMSEAIPGDGTLDYETLLRCMDDLGDAETPLHIEHLPALDDVARARDYIRSVAERTGITLT